MCLVQVWKYNLVSCEETYLELFFISTELLLKQLDFFFAENETYEILAREVHVSKKPVFHIYSRQTIPPDFTFPVV
jgi:hypothetical protein